MRSHALIVVALFSAACDRAGDTLSPVRGATQQASLALTAGGADLVTIFGPERFVRVNGRPATATRVISTRGFTTPFLLRVRNGNPDGQHRVSSATIRVDGVEIFSPNDFNQQFAGGEREIHPGSTVTLDVRLAAAPGGVLTIELLGKRAATRFCPSDFGDGVSHRFFSAAIAATEPGGTIVVCDGTHDINGVTITRPITIMPEHAGMVTITNRFNAIPFIVSAVPAGTVRITGLKFDLSALAGVAAFDVYDKVIVENSSFRFVGTARTSIAPTAVQVSASSGPSPDAMVTARGNTVTGMENGFVALGGRLDLADNTIDLSASHSIWYFPRTRGTIEGNRITSCGVNGCIRASPGSAGLVDVLNNRVLNDIARNTGRGIDFQGRGAVRGNVIVGVGGRILEPPLGAGSFAFRAGAILVAG
ncbi:MAG TPA: hypothetical protein VHJ82_07065, partial [Actinomycetota bacterium]|nr:hypothetical protein [Actinomycetota bacterium]